MTDLLDNAFARAARRSADDLNALAHGIMELPDDEQRWEDSFTRSQAALAELADEARTEYCAGN